MKIRPRFPSIVPLPALCVLVAAALLAAGCASTEIGPNEPRPAAADTPSGTKAAAPATTASGKGGYYLDDGPGADPPPDLDSIPDATPRAEPLHQASLRPYSALGQDYAPLTRLTPYKARGVATWYGRRYHGKPTSTGERYDMYAMTAAHTILPLPSYAKVTSLASGKSVVVRINDRGPFRKDRLIDLSYAAAHRLGLINDGSGMVEVETLLPGASALTVADPEPAPPPVRVQSDPALTPLPPTNGIFLQLGAFSEPGNAEDFARKMRTELSDLPHPVTVVSVSGLYRVQSGPFPDRNTARGEAERVASRLGSRPFVTVR